jgi:hypothetical protein
MGLTETQKPVILAAYAIISAYYVLCLYAAWVRPSLRRYRLLRPWWRGGVTASRSGVTAQAAFAFSLSLFGIARMFDLWWQPGALAALALSMLALIVTLFADHAAQGSDSR